jgi:hypothetical protein
VREVLRATGFDFKLTDYIHKTLPAGREMVILSHAYSVWSWGRSIESINDVSLGRLKSLQKEERLLGERLKEVNLELLEVERTKEMEKPYFLEKTRQMGEVKEEVSRLRAKKS